MKVTGIVRRFDDLGRIVVPKEIRKQLFGTYDVMGQPMEFFTDGKDIIIKKYADDVCEWREEGLFLYTSCGDRVNAYSDDFKYCPYCGKQIKVVE